MLQRSEPGVEGLYCPPAPNPPRTRLRLLELLATLARNPLECWSAEFFQEPIARVRLPFADAFLVHDPAAIKHVLVDNAANYRKDPIQRRILATGLADGLLSVEGDRAVKKPGLGGKFHRFSFVDRRLVYERDVVGRRFADGTVEQTRTTRNGGCRG